MKFLCPSCKAKYQIPDEKVAGRTLRMDCRRCGTNITIRADMAIEEDAPAAKVGAAASLAGSRRGAHASIARSASSAGGTSPGALGADFQRSVGRPVAAPAARRTPLDQWHVAIHDVPVGPLRRDEIAKKIAAGAATGDSLCWREGLDDWRPMKDLPELAMLLRRSGPGPLARPAPAARVSAPTRGATPAQRAPQRGAVVPIGGRLGGAAAPLLEPELDEPEADGEPTRVAAVDLATLESEARASSPAPHPTSPRRAEPARPSEPSAASTEARAEAISRVPVEAERPRRSEPEPAPERESVLPIGEPVFATTSAAANQGPTGTLVMELSPASPPAPTAAARAAPPVAERERRGGGGIPIGAWIGIAGAATFGAVLAYMVGTRFLSSPDAPATPSPPPAATAPTEPAPSASTPIAPIEAPPPEPEDPATQAAPEAPAPADEATASAPHPSTEARAARPASASPSTSARPSATTPASAPLTGRLADFADDSSDGPARLPSRGRSLADGDEESAGAHAAGAELTADQIRAVITRERPSINRCWETEIRRMGQAPNVRLDVDLTIGASGTVTRVTTRGQGIGELSTCIETVVRRWRFPSARGTTQTSFPLVLTAG